MTARQVRFFMIPQEFFDFVRVDLDPLNLELIQVEGDGWSASNQRPSRSRYLALRGVERPVTTRFDILHPGREGWVCVYLPVIEGKTLYMADISVRPWWSDPATGARTANPELERLFGQVARKLRKKLEFSVVVSSLSTHEGAVHKSNGSVYRSIGYSKDARSWLENGGEWKKEGCENIGYDLP